MTCSTLAMLTLSNRYIRWKQLTQLTQQRNKCNNHHMTECTHVPRRPCSVGCTWNGKTCLENINYSGKGDGWLAGGGGAHGWGDHKAQGTSSLHWGGEVLQQLWILVTSPTRQVPNGASNKVGGRGGGGSALRHHPRDAGPAQLPVLCPRGRHHDDCWRHGHLSHC